MGVTGRTRGGRVAKATALVVVASAVGAGVGLMTFRADSRVVVIGAHTATVSPSFDGYATLDFGPLVPVFRVPVDDPLGLGVRIDVGDTDVGSLNELITRDALIASQPSGEVQRIRAVVSQMVVDGLVRGGGACVLAAVVVSGLWRLIGADRRSTLRTAARRPAPRPRPVLELLGVTAIGALAVSALVLPGADAESASGSVEWVSLPSLFPELTLDDRLATVQVSSGGPARGGVELVSGAVSTYQRSVQFYGELTGRVADVAPALNVGQAGDTVALLLSDRHDNIGMDPVARAVADAGGATVVIDAGDDTSSGGDWEQFSVNSLATAFEGLDVVAVAGNHDQGGSVVDAYRGAGFTVLQGEPETVAGIRFLGDSDPRSSGLTAVRAEGEEPIEEQSARLADASCEAEDVAVVLVHSPAAGRAAADSGCVDLVLSGHVHRQLGPQTRHGSDGRPTTSYSNGTTGGAAYAFALGGALRRPAQVTLITFRGGLPVGIQPVSFGTDGTIEVAAYEPVGAGLAEPPTSSQPRP